MTKRLMPLAFNVRAIASAAPSFWSMSTSSGAVLAAAADAVAAEVLDCGDVLDAASKGERTIRD